MYHILCTQVATCGLPDLYVWHTSHTMHRLWQINMTRLCHLTLHTVRLHWSLTISSNTFLSMNADTSNAYDHQMWLWHTRYIPHIIPGISHTLYQVYRTHFTRYIAHITYFHTLTHIKLHITTELQSYRIAIHSSTGATKDDLDPLNRRDCVCTKPNLAECCSSLNPSLKLKLPIVNTLSCQRQGCVG